MAQTLQALGALVLASILALTTLQSRNASQVDRADSLIEVEATGVAAEVVETLAGLPFDEAAPPDPLTPKGEFGVTPALSPDSTYRQFVEAGRFRDLDDYDGIAGVAVVRALDDPNNPGTPRALTFEIRVQVDYVEEAPGGGWVQTGPPQTPTPHKRARVTVGHADADSLVVLERIYTDLR